MRVLNYHGVIDRAADDTHFSYLFTDVKDFEQQVALLARRARPVALAELDAAVRGAGDLPDDAVHVTLDDGYRNNLVAAEILDRYKVPWSLFVIVDTVLDGHRPWFLRLADAIRTTTDVTMDDGSRLDIRSHKAKRRFAKLAKAEIMAAPGGDQDGAVDRVLARSGMHVPPETHWPMLSVDDVIELRDAGVEIGNHSARHRNLRRCSAADLDREVERSRVRLEDRIGSPVRYFAYPDGRHGRRAHAAVGRGHALGFATWTARPPTAPLAMRRYEPLDGSELPAILDAPEYWYGRRWAGWTLPWRAREVAIRMRPTARVR